MASEKKLPQYRPTPTSTLIQNYFCQNMTQYRITTLIGILHITFHFAFFQSFAVPSVIISIQVNQLLREGWLFWVTSATTSSCGTWTSRSCRRRRAGASWSSRSGTRWATRSAWRGAVDGGWMAPGMVEKRGENMGKTWSILSNQVDKLVVYDRLIKKK